MKAQTKIRNSGRASFARANAFADTRQPHMTSALTGGRGLAQKKTIVLTGCLSGTLTRGRGPKISNFTDVICERPQTTPNARRSNAAGVEGRTDGRTNERATDGRTDGCGGRRSSLGRSDGSSLSVFHLLPLFSFLPSFLPAEFSIQNAMKDPQKVV